MSDFGVVVPDELQAAPREHASGGPMVLDQEWRDRLLLAIESSLQVRNAAAFFLWSQGALQAVIPHEILVCAVGRGANRGLQMRWFSSTRYFQEEQFRQVSDPQSGIVPDSMAEWNLVGHPQFFVDGTMPADMTRRLVDSELRNMVAHGVRGGDAHSAGYYCFSRTLLTRSRRSAHLVELVTPYVHAAFCRMLAGEGRGEGSLRTASPLVSERECQVLYLIKDGRTTADIAEVLNLSPFTVRNHVKNIFRKLGARSRSQAVAQAISHGILIQHYS